MGQHLVLTVRLHDARYHGAGEWPPSPARAFQALVAGRARGGHVDDRARAALEWLESLPPPVVAAPRAKVGARVVLFVPNNDLDAHGGDPRLVERTVKSVLPHLLEGDEPFVYAWPLGSAPANATEAALLAEDLYQLGRGLDMAWAVGEVLDDEELGRRLARHAGPVLRPTPESTSPTTLACPAPGSFRSLVARHAASRVRLRTEGSGKNATVLFTQPPKPRFVEVGYAAPASTVVYELRAPETTDTMVAWPLHQAVRLVERIRDAASHRLREALPDAHDAIERAVVGRKRDGADASPPGSRVRIVPLPSIGHRHADHGIRRVVVEVPAACALPPVDVHWAFSSLQPMDAETGEVDPIVLVAAPEGDGMLAHYVGPARTWRSVTPAALPDSAKRRRIEPSRQKEEAKGATERAEEERRAVAAVRAAARHADVRVPIVEARTQREPLEPKGARAERFAVQPRFPKERLWHVEVSFQEPIEGPLVLGDGRFLGLGLMVPVADRSGLYTFRITGGLLATAEPTEVARALRRAVMARAQAELGRGAELPTYFSGHAPSGRPARSEEAPHLAFHADLPDRLLVIAPHHLVPSARAYFHREELDLLARALDSFSELRAGPAGRLTLAAERLDDDDRLLRPARVWRSVTPYAVMRHEKRATAKAAITADVRRACAAAELPSVEVVVGEVRSGTERAVEAEVELRFAVAVPGPLVLGRTRYLGGGLFAGRSDVESNR